MTGTSIDKQALRRRYREERDKRLRPDVNDQYVRLTGQLAHHLDDPYTAVVEREPLADHVTVAFIGGDFGGTWYWNRYPGAQCDTASLVYLPLLEETGYVPSEKYATRAVNASRGRPPDDGEDLVPAHSASLAATGASALGAAVAGALLLLARVLRWSRMSGRRERY